MSSRSSGRNYEVGGGRSRGVGGGRGRYNNTGIGGRGGRSDFTGRSITGEQRGGSGGRGRGGGGDAQRGGGGSRTNNQPYIAPQCNEVLTNILLASTTASFEFYLYTFDAVDKYEQKIESRGQRQILFNKGFWDGLLIDMPKSQKDDLRRVLYYAGSFFFSSRPISQLPKSKLPLVLPNTDDATGDTMTVLKVIRYKVPEELRASSIPAITKGLNDLVVDPTHCSECTKTFTSIDGALHHSKCKDHMPAYVGLQGEIEAIPAPIDVFISFVNMALQKAMTERLLRWGSDYYDKDAPLPAKDRNGNDLGVSVFEAISLSFGIVKLINAPPSLALTCDLRAKVIRNISVLDVIYENRRGETGVYSNFEKDQLKRKWIGTIVIYKHDRKCYTITDLDFEHSAATLPIPDQKISHEEYFAQKGIHLEYPREGPMIVIEGRHKQRIYLPPELVLGNELDPKVRESLPQIASFTPDVRNKAIERVKEFLIPGKHKGTGGTLLPAVGIILEQHRLRAAARVLAAPTLMTAGIKIPPQNVDNWTAILGVANFNIDPTQVTHLNVVVFYHNDLKDGFLRIYEIIRDVVNKFHTHYRFGVKPFAAIPSGDNDGHWRSVEHFFTNDVPDNIFVLDFNKPKGPHDPSYYVIKKILGKGGFLSQFVNFKTCYHIQPSNERKSNMILNGIARQVLQKAGVRLWWVDIPKSLPLPAVFVGVDVFHAPMVYDPTTKQRGRKSSVAAIIVEIIRKGSSTPTRLEMYSKTFRRDGGEEYNLGDALKFTLLEAFRVLDVSPASVIVWRDGMPESAYMHANEEIRGIREGLQSRLVGQTERSNNQIPLAYIVCQKRIGTKLLTTDGNKGAPAGTLVTGVQGLENMKFYLNGRAPPFSTAKPVRYICMERDVGLKSVPLAELTWQQCHAYPNWTGSIKVPSVTQKAHKLAELAGFMGDGGDTINHVKYKNRDHFL